MTNVEKSWGRTVSGGVVNGLFFSIFALPLALGIMAGKSMWLWSFLTIPVLVVLCVLISTIARLVRAIRSTRPVREPRPDRGTGRVRVVLKRTAAVVGLLGAAGAGIALMGVGIKVATDLPTCDPELSRCTTVVDGVARGESNSSVGEQQVGNVLTGGIAFVPGLGILVATYFGASQLVRSISAGRR
ncbi:hypothetical protein EDC02_6431 [Micromonospora sp. Llam0]|uniref:hypothetical protein n=1 Tax=Micromonospora sp. Llam0 TaxID=2485143 RepID=UPI000F48C085|nr:hypothetical protein [Micromonospora sp. Llam0]ROO51551.1 hypothetical protein EDC02_6431 [Micromonospora sp. Llam0]